MQLDTRTVQVLKNFSSINPSILFKPGAVPTTVSPQKTVMARAAITETIPKSFAIYDLSRFLGVLSLFEKPTLTIDDKSMIIAGGQQKVSYTFADPKLIVTPNDKEVKMPDCEINFKLTADDLNKVLKAMGVLQLPEIAVTGDGESMNIEAIDSKNPSSDNYKVRLADTSLSFKMIFKAENIKIMSGDYDVAISSKGIAYFHGSNIEYWIATEASSTFGG